MRTYWNVQHIRNGEVIWQEKNIGNTLADAGARAILDLFWKRDTSNYLFSNFYVRLTNITPIVTSTLTSLSVGEPLLATGYTAQTVETSSVGFPTSDVASDGNQQLTSKVVTFTATAGGGGIGPVTYAFIGTTSDNTGILLCYIPLSMSRTILAGDSMTYSFSVEEGNS